MTELAPDIGRWYRPAEKGQPFQVVAIDEGAGTIEIQHFDGDLEELDLDEWSGLALEAIESPEDWTGPIDDIERDDLGYSDTGMTEDDWAESLTDHPSGEGAGASSPEDEDQP